MLRIYKKVGETPLELLERVRSEMPDFKLEKLSYAGRLDPMAEGETLVLVGEEENHDREKYLGLEKEYIATFLVGVATDSGDILGLIKNDIESSVLFSPANQTEIEKIIQSFKDIKMQTYPWFSGQTVDGIKLFEHYKAGNTEIVRPVRAVEIREVELKNCLSKNTTEIQEYIVNSIGKVNGDFRQKEILCKWQIFFDELIKKNVKEMQTIEIRIVVSSGTFIRGLTENFPYPAVLLSLKRTKIVV